MTVHYRSLRSHQCLDLPLDRSDALFVLHGSGHNQQVMLPARWTSIVLPLRGVLDIGTSEYQWLLERGELLVWRDAPLQAAGRRGTAWLAVCGSPDGWARYRRPRHGAPAPAMLPAEHRCDRQVRRLLAHLARVSRGPIGSASAAATTAGMLGAAITEQQRELYALLPRCNGRTRQRKEQTLMRLLRVRHLIQRYEEGRVDLVRLAASASYSPCHLIRSYREVFGETPSEHAARLRADKAWRLVRETRLPVCEITAILGFESQSAFCRAFKTSFGMTTSQARQLGSPASAYAPGAGQSDFSTALAA